MCVYRYSYINLSSNRISDFITAYIISQNFHFNSKIPLITKLPIWMSTFTLLIPIFLMFKASFRMIFMQK